ncbi:YdiU family protein [uncultured Thiothrix sp.]|uniref:protein adenylyltransferase SelO n=1 Tax=uncultured Thiothrix sp. TaxID=223185 RepID=UPI002607A072|nr:YdiU family protein [uncultured Thiothrix sp.]
MYTLDTLPFQNRFAQLPAHFYARVRPTPLANAQLFSFNAAAAQLIQLDPREAQNPAFTAYFNGERAWEGTQPISMLYAGHQFGTYVPQLGDGRAIILGETQGWELQLKGSGPTPFSRFSDGRAVIRSTVREYLCSEAMQALGIPTTRALCMLVSDEEVYRERLEQGALLVRMSPSHVRFGSFEVFFHRRQYEQLKQLADFVLANHFPELQSTAEPYLGLLETVVKRTARLMAQWQCVGFAHGVMNTDNMSILGLTLDYGPYGFLDVYDPGFICNHTDQAGRYAFDQQPSIGLWNLNALAHTFLPLLAEDPDEAVEKARSALLQYQAEFDQAWLTGMRAKLGLQQAVETDEGLIADLLIKMQQNLVDYTIFFRRLSKLGLQANQSESTLRDLFVERSAFDAWAIQYRERLLQEQSVDIERQARMQQVNPVYILRNYMAQQAIAKAEQGDASEVDLLLKLLQQPFTEQAGMESYSDHPPAWADSISVSCSS